MGRGSKVRKRLKAIKGKLDAAPKDSVWIITAERTGNYEAFNEPFDYKVVYRNVKRTEIAKILKKEIKNNPMVYRDGTEEANNAMSGCLVVAQNDPLLSFLKSKGYTGCSPTYRN